MSEKINIHTIRDLKDCLRANAIELSDWGKGNAKNLEQLFEEIINGECWLHANPLIRVLPIVQVLIHADGNILVETAQELTDQRMRERNLPPSEKMKPNEDWHSATIRCVEEELSVTPNQINFVTRDCTPIVRQRNSQSYPGLSSQYHIYKVDVLIDSLPVHDFWTDEKKGSNQDNAILRHHWSWKNPATINI
jgi:hypothetical protein